MCRVVWLKVFFQFLRWRKSACFHNPFQQGHLILPVYFIRCTHIVIFFKFVITGMNGILVLLYVQFL